MIIKIQTNSSLKKKKKKNFKSEIKCYERIPNRLSIFIKQSTSNTESLHNKVHLKDYN